MSIIFSVSRVEPGARAIFQQSYEDHATVKVGDSKAWVGESITKDCGEPPEEGHSTTVLIWFRGNVGMTLSMYPIPECEPGALTLAQAIEVAELVADCRGFNTGTPSAAGHLAPALRESVRTSDRDQTPLTRPRVVRVQAVLASARFQRR